MASLNGKSVVAEDEAVRQAHQKYQIMKQKVEQWRQERGPYWRDTFNLAEKPPYLPVRDLPVAAIIELWQRLNLDAEVKIADSTLRELWGQYIKDENTVDLDAEMLTRLQMAVSGVAYLGVEIIAQENIVSVKDGQMAGDLRCPVCGKISMLALLESPAGKRRAYCTLCGYKWQVKRVGCLYCGSGDAKEQIYLQNESCPGVEIVVCRHCGQYCKEIDERKLSVQDYVWEDLRTLHMNYAAERWAAENGLKAD